VYAAVAGAGSYGDYERRQRLEVVGYLGAALYAGASLWSMIDAPLSAMDINRRAGRTNLLLRPAPDGLTVGLRLPL
jgi:hypothetical protein